MKKLLLLFALGVSVSAAGLPELRLPGSVGVNIHFTRGHERDLDLIQAAGIRVVRMDFVWASIERSKGQYDWSAYDELTASLLKRGIRPYYILDYSNGLYEETVATINPVTGKEQRDVASPQRPESVAAFARWAAAAVERFKGRGIVWEIWNEPNITFWKPKPDVQQYIALAQAACKAIRAADPEALVVGPATSELPLPFLERFFASGILAQLDAVSVHPYRNYSKGPETALEEYQKLRELIEKYAPEGKKQMPILSGEWGYASHTKGVSLETQANFLVRQQLVNLHAGLPISIWYDWKNDGPNPAEREDNFGTVSHNLEPKPAYLALQRMTRELDGFGVVRRLETGNPNAWALLLADRSGKQKLAAWSAAGPLKAQLTPEIALDLTPAPQYVTLERPIR